MLNATDFATVKKILEATDITVVRKLTRDTIAEIETGAVDHVNLHPRATLGQLRSITNWKTNASLLESVAAYAVGVHLRSQFHENHIDLFETDTTQLNAIASWTTALEQQVAREIAG